MLQQNGTDIRTLKHTKPQWMFKYNMQLNQNSTALDFPYQQVIVMALFCYDWTNWIHLLEYHISFSSFLSWDSVFFFQQRMTATCAPTFSAVSLGVRLHARQRKGSEGLSHHSFVGCAEISTLQLCLCPRLFSLTTTRTAPQHQRATTTLSFGINERILKFFPQ